VGELFISGVWGVRSAIRTSKCRGEELPHRWRGRGDGACAWRKKQWLRRWIQRSWWTPRGSGGTTQATTTAARPCRAPLVLGRPFLVQVDDDFAAPSEEKTLTPNQPNSSPPLAASQATPRAKSQSPPLRHRCPTIYCNRTHLRTPPINLILTTASPLTQTKKSHHAHAPPPLFAIPPNPSPTPISAPGPAPVKSTPSTFRLRLVPGSCAIPTRASDSLTCSTVQPRVRVSASPLPNPPTVMCSGRSIKPRPRSLSAHFFVLFAAAGVACWESGVDVLEFFCDL
jgi:hypothetical protein